MPTTDECLSCKQTQDSLAETWQAEIAKLREQVTTLEAQLAEAKVAIIGLLAVSLPIMGEWSGVVGRARKALSGDTTQVEQEARIGRAVVEWQKREAVVMATMGSRGWREAISTLGKVIAQAKAGEHT